MKNKTKGYYDLEHCARRKPITEYGNIISETFPQKHFLSIQDTEFSHQEFARWLQNESKFEKHARISNVATTVSPRFAVPLALFRSASVNLSSFFAVYV